MIKKRNSLVKSILLVEDDLPLAFMIRKQLEQMGYEVATMNEGTQGLSHALSNKYALLILDIGLPQVSGLQIVKRVRDHDLKTPMIIITSQHNRDSELETFKRGANIFHPKPIDFELLAAQINFLLELNSYKPVIEVGDLHIEPQKRFVQKAGDEIKLTYKEFELLMLLVGAEGNVLTRDEILNRTFKGVRESEEGSVDTLVSRLRKKLGTYKEQPVIETVHSLGFRLNLVYVDHKQAA